MRDDHPQKLDGEIFAECPSAKIGSLENFWIYSRQKVQNKERVKDKERWSKEWERERDVSECTFLISVCFLTRFLAVF